MMYIMLIRSNWLIVFVGSICGCVIWKYIHMTSSPVLSVRRCIRGLSLFHSFVLCPLIYVSPSHCLLLVNLPNPFHRPSYCISTYSSKTCFVSLLISLPVFRYLVLSSDSKHRSYVSTIFSYLETINGFIRLPGLPNTVLSYLALDYLFHGNLLRGKSLNAMLVVRVQWRETVLSVQRHGCHNHLL